MAQLKAKVDILGSEISVWDLKETVDQLCALVKGGGRHYVCVSNVHTVMMGKTDPEYANVTNGATLATADGVPLIWASKLLGGPAIHGRASGPDILAAILKKKEAQSIRHYFYGSTPTVLQSLESGLKNITVPSQLAGFYSPPMRPAARPSTPLSKEELEDCEKINAANPDIIWVGLGAPKQEIWMRRARPHLNAAVLIGVGAAFDFLSGNKSRAPEWMQSAGLEWAFRFMQEPKRLAGRYLKTNPAFVAEVLKAAVFKSR